jgi:predicted regulator of Ras-like GTPase activity (Roadblock/LC7/MglB family)
MAPKFGNYLFRNLKGQTSEPSTESAAKQSDALGTLEEQTIVLQEGDLEGEGLDAPLLDWSKAEEGKIQVQLKDTEGLLEGRVTVKASILQGICPRLFVDSVKKEYLYSVSLKTVVLQIQAHLKRYQWQTTTPVGPDFDTPIAQVAREDEGFFKLEENARPVPSPEKVRPPDEPSGPLLTPADRPTFPLIREKLRLVEEQRELRTEVDPLEVFVQPPKPFQPCTVLPEKPKFDPFQDLPKIGLKQVPHLTSREDSSNLGKQSVTSSAQVFETIQTETTSNPPTSSKPLRRIGLERLQEIFLTEDLLDARQVARLVASLPKVKGVLILFEDGTVMGGNLPQGFNIDAAFMAPNLARVVQQFHQGLSGEEVSGLMILGDLPISLFFYGNISLLIAHEGRGLLPGMRERMSEVARALHALYDGLTIES